MPMREKRAWFVVLVNLAVYGFYFTTLAVALADGEASHAHFMGLMFKSIVLLVVVLIVLNIAAAAMAPKDAQTPEDEREKLIAWRSSHFAFFVLSAAGALAIMAIYFGVDGFLTANGLFLAMVIAEIARNAMQIYYFRRGM